MSKRYIFIILILVSIVFVLLLYPKVYYCANDTKPSIHYSAHSCTNLGPKSLLLEAISTSRYINVDKTASLLVGEDPSYVFVDLRDAKQYVGFTLPRAVNIPYQKALEETNHAFFSNDDTTKILFSNGTLIADQVWSILRKKGYRNLLVLKGGLNEFYQKVLNPVKPTETESKDAFNIYSFRKAAGIYFGLPNPDTFIPELKIEPVKREFIVKRTTNTKKRVIIKAKAKPKSVEEEEEEEGC